MGAFDFDVIGRSLGYLFREGMTFTLTLTALAAAGGIVFGTLLAMMRLSSFKWLSLIATGRAASDAMCEEMQTLLQLQQDRERLARYLPANVGFGGKSGTLAGIIHDCGLLATPNGTIAAAVLTWNVQDRYNAQTLIGRIGTSLIDEVWA